MARKYKKSLKQKKTEKMNFKMLNSYQKKRSNKTLCMLDHPEPTNILKKRLGTRAFGKNMIKK